MIEGGGLGIYTPEEVCPMSMQVPNGVVDILVNDEAAAVATAKKYLSYFQGPIDDWEEGRDQRHLRHTIPENRVRLYGMREIIHTLADKGSVLEIREKFGIGVITAFIRIEGKPMGVLANNPHHLAGAVDSDGADKGVRFLQLCDAFDIPVLSLIDCPGIMVGPEHEKTALVRHCTRLFNTGANLTTPLFTVVVRKSYGLGAQAMCGGSALVGFMTVAWPTAEFAGMNIEGAVKLGFRPVLAAIEDPEERIAEFDRRVESAYEVARAVNAGSGGGIDDVIDPADTRRWIANSLKNCRRWHRGRARNTRILIRGEDFFLRSSLVPASAEPRGNHSEPRNGVVMPRVSFGGSESGGGIPGSLWRGFRESVAIGGPRPQSPLAGSGTTDGAASGGRGV